MTHLLRAAGLAAFVLLLAACGGGSGAAPEPFDIQPTAPPTTGSGGSTTPPPTPSAPVWNANAFPHDRVMTFGSFPSDLVRHGNVLLANDADEIGADGAHIRAVDIRGTTPTVSTTWPTTTITAPHLVDSTGQAASVPTSIGFGLFLNDLHVVSNTLAFALANAGGSDSTPTLANLVVFNPEAGAILQTVDLAHEYIGLGTLFDSTGSPVPDDTFVQSGAESVAYVSTGPTTGLLYVAMSNLIFGAPSFGAHRFPGTVQVYAVDMNQPQPLAAMPELGQATRTIRTTGYNPVSVDAFQSRPANGASTTRLLVTCGGTTGFDSSFNLVPTSDAIVEAYDGTTSAFLGSFTMGRVGLVGGPALGSDASGNQLGYFPSGVTGQVYVLELTGLYNAVINPLALSIVRGPGNGIPIAGPSGSPGGNITGIALSPDGRTLVVAGFGDLFSAPRKPGKVFLATLPDDVVTGAGFGVSFTVGATEFASAVGRTVGRIVLDPNTAGRPDVYVNVGGSLDDNGIGDGPASVGTIDSQGIIR